MPVQYQTWKINVRHGREAEGWEESHFDIQVGPDRDHVEVTMAVCAIIGNALCDMKIDEAEIGDGYDLIIDVRRKN